MFKEEWELQHLAHTSPEVVLSGIPEISSSYCSDAGTVVSLGREIPLDSGRLDNLYVDANAILTIVECKQHGDSRIKREVYSQALNYASDIQNMLHHYTGQDFIDQFFQVLAKARGLEHKTLDDLMTALAKGPFLAGKDTNKWRTQFEDRLEYNIKRGVFRIIILCGASSQANFSAQMIRNLMQLMTFSEKENARYDLLLMDIRESSNGEYTSKIIWRRYAILPEIPLLASISRDTSRGIEAMRDRRTTMQEKNQAAGESLIKLLNMLGEANYIVEENTSGYAIYKDDRKSIFTVIKIEEGGWQIVRHQIRKGEPLYAQMEPNTFPKPSGIQDMQILTKESSASDRAGAMYELVITPSYSELPNPQLFRDLSR